MLDFDIFVVLHDYVVGSKDFERNFVWRYEMCSHKKDFATFGPAFLPSNVCKKGLHLVLVAGP